MRLPKVVNYGLVTIFVIIILALLVGQLLGQPMLIFVETGSMEPTLEPNDGFVAIPQQFAGDIQEGDVVLFDAEEVGGGGLTTHRVEAVTDEGYITKGDANPFTDQDGGEPIVADGQIRSVAIQPTGDLVVLPQIGAGVEFIAGLGHRIADPIANAIGIETPDGQTAGIVILTTGLFLFVLSSLGEGATAVRSRIRKRKDLLDNIFVVIAILTLVVLIPLNVSMLMPSGVYSFEIVSSATPSDSEGVIQAGESEEVTYMMQNSGHLPVMVFLEPASAGVEIPQQEHRVSRASSEEVGVVMHAPEETGSHLRMVQEHRYLMVLPPSIISTFHHIHPFAAIGVINIFVIIVVSALTLVTVGTDRDRSRDRTRRGITWTDKLFK